MTPETNREGASAPSALPEIVANWHLPDDSDAPAEIDDRPPWPDDSDGPRFTFPELVEQEALGYRAWGNEVGDFLARQMEELAQLIRCTHATTPDEYESRKAAWDAEVRDAWEARGFEAGRRCGDRLP
jgi:hypothetical protein